MRRSAPAALVVFACLTATRPALACVPFQYVSAVAHGHVRAANGDWVPISLETDRSLLRLEYTSFKSPTGRYAIVGNIDDDWAYGFAVGGAWGVSSPPKRVSMQRLLKQAGLPTWVFAQYAGSQDPSRTFKRMQCKLTAARDSVWPDYPPGAHVCLHDVWDEYAGGLPLFAENAQGDRVLEMDRVERRAVPLDRFNPPRPEDAPLVVASRSPTTCGG